MLRHLRARAVGVPLLIERGKLDVILGATTHQGPLARRLGLAAPARADMPGEGEPDDDEAPSPTRPSLAIGDGVATISVSGTLLARAGEIDALSGVSSYEAIGQALDTALADPRVEGILLDLDSPGGEYAGAIELGSKILAARQVKPICASVGYLAASAGYALACAASRVVCPPSGTVGSIGVVALHVDESGADAEEGCAYTYLFRGARKVDGNPHEPLTDAARAAFGAQLDAAFAAFVAHVAAARGLSADAVKATEAGLFTGPEAVAKGLADEVGGATEARAWLAAQIKERHAMKDLQARLSALETSHATLLAERDGLKAQLATIEREKDAAYVEGLKAQSAALQAPLTAAQVEGVERQIKAGNREAAHAIGAALLEAAKARATGPASPAATVPLVPTPKAKADLARERANAAADRFEAASKKSPRSRGRKE